MTLDQWIEHEIETLQKFKIDWLENQKELPWYYPGEMDHGEWDEQYRSFTE